MLAQGWVQWGRQIDLIRLPEEYDSYVTSGEGVGIVQKLGRRDVHPTNQCMTASISLEWDLHLELIYSIRFEELFFYCYTRYARFYIYPNVCIFIPSVTVSWTENLKDGLYFLMCTCAFITIFTVATKLGDFMGQMERGPEGGGGGANIYILMTHLLVSQPSPSQYKGGWLCPMLVDIRKQHVADLEVGLRWTIGGDLATADRAEHHQGCEMFGELGERKLVSILFTAWLTVGIPTSHMPAPYS